MACNRQYCADIFRSRCPQILSGLRKDNLQMASDQAVDTQHSVVFLPCFLVVSQFPRLCIACASDIAKAWLNMNGKCVQKLDKFIKSPLPQQNRIKLIRMPQWAFNIKSGDPIFRGISPFVAPCRETISAIP